MIRRTAIALLLLALVPATASADGALDRSFGYGGSASYAPERFSTAAGVAVDSQGRVLVAATLVDGSPLGSRAAVLRLSPNGTPDPAFGVGGVTRITPPAPYSLSSAEAIAVDAQGRILLAGEVDGRYPALARLLPTGALDPAFASGGLLVAAGIYGWMPGGWKALALDGSSIVVAGAVDSAPPYGTGLGRVAVVARIGENGAPDTTFAGSGFLQLPVPGVTFASRRSVAIDRSGRIVLGIWRATTTAFPGDVSATIVRLTNAGALDGSFGSGGLAALGALRGHTPTVSSTHAGAILAVGGWVSRTGTGIAGGAQVGPDGQFDERFGSGGELPALVGAPGESVLDCQGDLLTFGRHGIWRVGPDGRLDRTFKAGHVPPVAVGGITRLASYFAVAAAPDGSIVIAGTAVDGATVPGGEHPVGYSAIAVARLTATCPIMDVKPPSLKLKCSAGCRRVLGTALDDPVGGGVRRVLLGIERIAGTRCEAWNGRRFVRLACAEAATRLVATRVVDGSFRTQPLAVGHYVVRARAVDRAGNDAEVVARISR